MVLGRPTDKTLQPSHIVGVLLTNLVPFYAPLLNGLEEAAKRLDYLPIVCFGHDNVEEFRRLARQLISANIEGLIAVAAGSSIDPADMRGLPTVCIDAPQFGTNSLVFSLESAGFQATRHLIYHGHSRIALVTAPLDSYNNRDAARGYRRALRAAHLPLDKSLVFEASGFLREFGYDAGRRILKMKDLPQAVFASGDILALGAMQAFRDAGKQIPEDIAIVSKDNSEWCDVTDPPLTSVAFPTFEAGAASMHMLHAILRDGRSRKKTLVPGARLVIRSSCGCDSSQNSMSNFEPHAPDRLELRMPHARPLRG